MYGCGNPDPARLSRQDIYETSASCARCWNKFVFVITVKLVAWIHANPPPAMIQGENLVLETEIQMPPEWSPQSVAARAQSNCRLAPNTDRENGIVEWDRMERPSDSGWVIPCSLRPSSFLSSGLGIDICSREPMGAKLSLYHSAAIRVLGRLPWHQQAIDS